MSAQPHGHEVSAEQAPTTNSPVPAQHSGWFRSTFRDSSRLLFLATTATTLLSLASPLAEAASPPAALVMARYAVATATHDQPAHVVIAADVSNAVATFTTLNDQLILEYNLGNLLGTPRVVGWINSSTYAWTCVSFPNSIAGSPQIVPGSGKAHAALLVLPNLLNLSRNAVAAAASHHKAVSGADVAAAAASVRTSLAPKPTFIAGQGGKVRFTTKVETGSNTFAVFICVQFPRTAYGIPVQVSC